MGLDRPGDPGAPKPVRIEVRATDTAPAPAGFPIRFNLIWRIHMKSKYLLGALVLSLSTAAFAAEPAPTPEKSCCCCKKDELGQMACCKEHGEQAGEHAGHDMSGMDHK